MMTREEFDTLLGGYCRKCETRHDCPDPCELMLKALTYADQQDAEVARLKAKVARLKAELADMTDLQQGTLELYGAAEAECESLKADVARLDKLVTATRQQGEMWMRDYEAEHAEVERLTERVRELEDESARRGVVAGRHHSFKHDSGGERAARPAREQKTDEQKLADGDILDDGCGSTWSAWCPECGKKAMQIVRPGKVQCAECG